MSARVNFAKLMCITNYVYWLRAVKTSAEPITACVSKEAAYATEAVRGIKHTCGSVYQHSGAIRHRLPVNSAKTHTFLHAWTHTHTRGWWEDSVPGSRQAVPLFFCSMASCFSRVSLSSLSLNSSIFSSVFSSCTCFSWARALSIATLSRPCARTHTHTHMSTYTHRDVQKKGRAGSGERESDVGYLRASRWSDSKPHWKCVTAALCAAAHSSEAEHRAKSWLLRHDSFQAYYHLCGAFYLWRCLYLLAAPQLPQDLETWTWI